MVFDIRSDLSAGKIEKNVPLVVSFAEAKSQFNIALKGEKTRVRHTLAEVEKEGVCAGYTELPPDVNLQDNRFYFACGKQPKQKTLILTKNKLLGDILSAAAAPQTIGENVDVKVCSITESADQSFDDIALLIWAGFFPSGEMREKLTNFLNNGGVALFLPPDTPGKDGVEEKQGKNRNRWSQIINFPKTEPQHVVEWFHSGGPLADTISGTSLPVDSLEIFRIRTLIGEMKTASALYRSGRPFLYVQNAENRGRLYICSTLPLSNWSNLGEGIILVPMLTRMKLEGAQRFSRIIYADCGIWHHANGAIPEYLTEKDSSRKISETLHDPKYNSGVYSSGDKTIVLNRPKAEDIAGRIDKTEVMSLFKERPFYMFNESNENNSAFQSEIWRWFLIAMFCFLMAESFLVMPPKKQPVDTENSSFKE